MLSKKIKIHSGTIQNMSIGKTYLKNFLFLFFIFFMILLLNISCIVDQVRNPLTSDSSENDLLKIEKSRLTLQSHSSQIEIIWEFRILWKIQEEVNLIVKDKENSAIYFLGKIKPEKFMILTSNPLEPDSPQNKWLTEGLDSDSFRTLVFIVQTDLTEPKSLETSIRIKKETKYSLKNKFNVR